MKDMINNVDYQKSIKPQNVTATTNGTGVDLQGYHGAMVVFDLGDGDFASADEVYTPKIQESDDDATYTDVAAADQDGTLTAADAEAEDDAIQKVGYKGTKRYIRAVMTVAGTTPSIQMSAGILRGFPRKGPVA